MTTTHRYIATVSFQEDDEAKITTSSDVSITNAVETNVTVTIADGTTDQQHTVTLNDTKIKSLYFLSTRDLLVEVNDGDSPDFSINLVANTPTYWHTELGTSISDFFGVSEDMNDLYLTNSSGSSAYFIFRSIRSA